MSISATLGCIHCVGFHSDFSDCSDFMISSGEKIFKRKRKSCPKVEMSQVGDVRGEIVDALVGTIPADKVLFRWLRSGGRGNPKLSECTS